MAVNEGLASLSDHLYGGAMALYAAGMLGYAAEFAFSRFGRAGAEADAATTSAAGSAAASATLTAKPTREPALVGATAAGDAPAPAKAAAPAAGATSPATGGSDFDGADDEQPARALLIGRIAVVLTVLGWALHLSSVVTRGFAAGRVPWGNMYEFSSMICLIAITAFLVLLVRFDVRWLGVFVTFPVLVYMGLAGTVLYVAAGPLVPALNSYWLKIHVVAAILASGIYLVSAVTTVLFLVKDRWEHQLAEVAAGRAEVTAAMRSRGGIVMKLPAAASLDTLTYRLIAFGFPVWTFAVIAGAIWAEAAWGRYWGWDPKETWSFITWVCYAAYLHARATAGWRGKKAAAVSLVAFSALFVDYYVVNLFLTGLHSYAGVSA
ncbi:c-type cytochrome biogenesis protein CcsB [Frankia sp. AgB1.9]|uniref:c-type cytochrome biogenesis protein CcsB n=1 Tax=unclassified Frankia TaxID=2632575 RepID=UPI001931CBC9|nr:MULTISPECIES: c-type cytochrome biogenesis protein CcsB [unclassified Frankia]MBL7488448.1 c-type cytochrome biogenesis protein CcsB [Frankia sp. AgW1.1]MBL7550140.1 c-type cytochrome biogenesis protein CcsB [Frankia sp. AgB1.9]MBL7625009.1 c-type cytochrome biogenesis protein CcsB [Frankia sp. AgB1.8]